jgi:hypothetical protein
MRMVTTTMKRQKIGNIRNFMTKKHEVRIDAHVSFAIHQTSLRCSVPVFSLVRCAYLARFKLN